jgi:RimJ/RimL family protein N-acetyltransferase
MQQLTPGAAPQPCVLTGQYCRLEPLTAAHAPDLFEAISGPQTDARHRYLFEHPPASAAALADWIDNLSTHPDQMHFGVIDLATQKCAGRQAFLRLRPEHRSIEIGSVLWGAGIAGTRNATEALYLMARHVFEDLGYFRFEWKCNDLNMPSKRAAIRFGFKFEGVFRKDLIIKDQHRDTAWFSMLDDDWESAKLFYDAWLSSENFNAEGREKTKLATPRA